MKRSVLCVLALLAGVLAPGSSAASSIPQLAGTTIISGSHAAGIQVELLRKTRFGDPMTGETSVKVEGSDSFAGFALVAEDVPERDGYVFYGGRVPRAAGSHYFVDIGGDWFRVGDGRWFSLQPGIYTLYLLPGSGETTVTLTFQDLVGETHLTPTHRVDYGVELGEQRYEVGPTDNYYAASAVGKLDGRGLVGGATWLTADAHAATNAQVCFWRNEPRDPDAYLPNCGDLVVAEPGNSWGSAGWLDFRPSASSVFKLATASWHPFSSGFSKPGLRYGVSFKSESVSLARDVGSVAFWLSYI